MNGVPLLVLATCLATAGAWDLMRRRIPNEINVATALLGLAAAVVFGSPAAIGHAIAGAALVFGLLLLAYRQRWIGGGDVKLGAAIGAWLGPIGGVYALVGGVALSGVFAVVLLARGGSAFRASVKANLVLACYTGRVGETSHRPDSAHIPLGTALAVSTLAIYVMRGGAGA